MHKPSTKGTRAKAWVANLAIMSHPTVPVELPSHLRQEISAYRARNQLPLVRAGKVLLPAGISLSAISAGGAVFYTVAAISALIAVVCARPLLGSFPKAVNAAQTEYRDGDYPAVAYWAPILPVAAPLLAIPFADQLPDLSLPPILQVLLGGVYLGAACTLGVWSAFSLSYRIGRRRMLKILKKGSLDGVTNAALQAVDSHSETIAALCACGAVDGNEVNLDGLSKLTSRSVEELSESLKSLAQLGLIDIKRLGAHSNPGKWQVSLTPVGIRCLGQSGR